MMRETHSATTMDAGVFTFQNYTGELTGVKYIETLDQKARVEHLT